MPKPVKYTGFLTYVPGGDVTPELLHDYSFLARKILSGWSALNVEPEDFVGYCIEKLYRRIHLFDPNLGTIQTFLWQVILNECRRLWSMQKSHYTTELDYERWESMEWDDSIRDAVRSFCSWAFDRGLYVEPLLLYDGFLKGSDHPIVELFSWKKSRGEL